MNAHAGYRGCRNSLPEESERLFRISIAFFAGDEAEFDRLVRSDLPTIVERCDPKLFDLLNRANADMKAAKMKVYIGDADGNLDKAFER